ncbi:YbjN domain-containing protein [Deinococcus radiopugnans]|uniref:YbjN domain-containing protein n=1 Tax=Deinococcus radiopugnans ATCC 19172 TaxID=585398 RepID=A0A5C4XZC6_9DEIO|nr:YbjN domain-containing protein [Deinococcus radiopugnans]MBB6018182.1 hypothetical protein [Deinococcus radiopugnans ATCC 19172]TNM68152.1 YbjN domain-containing protein [Deinococcus radiopugnans ATCC 19172]
MTKLTPVPLVCAFFSVAAAASGPVLDARPATLVQVLTAAGYQPSLRLGDAKTDPSIAVKVNGEALYLYLSGCKAGDCQRVTVSTRYDRSKMKANLVDLISTWNANWYTQAYLDKDGDPYLDASYFLTGGYTQTNFLNWLRDYLSEMDEFDTQVF